MPVVYHYHLARIAIFHEEERFFILFILGKVVYVLFLESLKNNINEKKADCHEKKGKDNRIDCRSGGRWGSQGI